MAQSLAIVIGIDNYGSSRASLKGPVADATAFAEWLLTTGHSPDQLCLGLYRTAESAPLPPGLAACPTFDPTLAGLQKLLLPVLPSDSGPLPPALDRLWFYFSGHGASSTSSYYVENAMCLKEFEFGLWMHTLEMGSLRQVLTGIPARERFLFIDGCRDHVLVGAPRFGQLSSPNRAPGARANYELFATADGRKAIEKRSNGNTVRGLFSRHLVAGLGGAGAAKRWAGDGGDDRYLVNWSTLTAYVAAQVADDVGASPSTDDPDHQLVMTGGEHTSNDPLLAVIPPGAVTPSAVTVTLTAPAAPPPGTQIVARRSGSFDPDIEAEWVGTTFTLLLPPSTWQLTVRAASWRAQPKMRTINAYADAMTATLAMEQLVTVPDGSVSASDATNFGGAITLASGGLAVTVGGTPIAAIRPAPLVVLRRAGGPVIAADADWKRLDPGIYNLRIEGSMGAMAEETLLIEEDNVTAVDFALASAPTPGMAATAAMARIPLAGDGGIMPSEALGWLAGSLATVVAIAASKAAQGATDAAAALGLHLAAGAGVQFVIADERGSADMADERGSADMADVLPRARLWGMFKTNAGIHAAMHAGTPPEVLTTCYLPAPSGGYWFQLLAPDGGTAGFKVATYAAPGHRSLVIRHLVAAGRVELLQFALPLAASGAAPDWRLLPIVNAALVEAEAVQRALLNGVDPLAIAALDAMLALDWSEPFTSWAIAARLVEREDAGAVALLERMVSEGAIDRLGASVEASVIHGVRAERSGDTAAAKAHFEAALRGKRVPIVDRLLDVLVEALARHEIRGAVPRWLRAKAQQSVHHPLWTLRRADDKRGGGIPDAA